MVVDAAVPMASLLRSLTGVRQLVFRDSLGRFSGMASPAAVVDGLASEFPVLNEFGNKIRMTEASWDIERETNRQTMEWQNLVPQPAEWNLKVDVRAGLLELWLGERWVSRCIRLDGNDLSMSQVQQIVDSLLPDVPVQRGRQAPPPNLTFYELLVVDRDAFALELARQWVRSGLPRSPVR